MTILIALMVPVLAVFYWAGCKGDRQVHAGGDLVRFERILFESTPQEAMDTINGQLAAILPFFRVFNEEIIRVGPDTLPEYPSALDGFTKDPVISSIYKDINKNWPEFAIQIRILEKGFDRMEQELKMQSPLLVTYLSGFNESFITLPGILGIGLDKYLGSDYPYYRDLRIPEYIRARMNPASLASDGLKAWLMSELEAPLPGSTFLDHMIYHGKIHYLLRHFLKGVPEHLHFHFTEGQHKWCREHEREMWKFLAENRILFSTDRMTIRKYHEDAPFTRDFGNDSPGKAGCWIGYRVVQSYLKATGQKPGVLLTNISSQTILSESRYRP